MNTIRRIRIESLFISCCFLVVLVLSVRVNNAQIEFTKNRPDLSLKAGVTVDPATLGLSLSIPLGNHPGRNGVDVPVNLYYSSKAWRMSFIDRREYPAPDQYQGYLLEPMYAENSLSGWTSSVDRPWIDFDVPESGWGYSQTSGISGNCANPPSFPNPCYFISRMFVHMPDGSSLELRKDDVPRTSPGHGTGIYYSTDGANARMDFGTNTLYLADGSRYVFSAPVPNQVRKAIQFTDVQGNKLVFNDSLRTWTDTLGRSVSMPFPNDPTPGTARPEAGDYPYTIKGINNENLSYTLKWRKLEDVRTDPSQALRHKGSNKFSYGNPLRPEPSLFVKQALNYVCSSDDLFNPTVLAEIVLPNGSSYKFTYNIYGEIDKVKYPYGGYESFDLGYVVAGYTGNIYAYDQPNRGVLERRVSASGLGNDEQTWQYTKDNSTPANPYQTNPTILTAPNNTKTKYFYYAPTTSLVPFGLQDVRVGKPRETQILASNGTTILRRTLSEWSSQGPTPGGFSSATRNPFLVKQIEILFESGNSQALSKTTTFQYDQYLNVLSATENKFVILDAGFAATAPPDQVPIGNASKTSETDYVTDAAYLNQQLVSLERASRIKNELGTVVAKSETFYDEAGYSVLTYGTGTVGWDDPGAAKRALPTTTKAWDSSANGGQGNWIVSHMQYDQFGNLRRTWSPVYEGQPAGNLSEVRYEDNFADAVNRNSYAFPTKTISVVPDQTGQHGSNTAHETAVKYDFYAGLAVSATDPNNQVTAISYADPTTGQIDPFLRVRKVIAPNSQQTITEYGTPDQTGQFPATERFIRVKTQIDGTKWKTGITWFDGLGRTSRTQMLDSAGDVFIDFEYDNMGRRTSVSNPYRNTTAPNCLTNLQCTTTDYDELGRVVKVTTPDGSETNSVYGLATIGANIGTVVTLTDAAGKVRRSITNDRGQVGRVDEPTDSGGLGNIDTPNQPTSYTYDVLNNVRTIVQGVQTRTFTYGSLSRLLSVTNPESGTIALQYDSSGNLTGKTDAEGIHVTFAYDKLNRLIQKAYSGESGYTTPTVTYRYDGVYYDSQETQHTATGAAKGKLSGVSSSVSRTNHTAFDNVGRITQSQQITGGIAYNPMSYTYDLSDGLIEQTYPSGRVVKNVLNNNGDLATVQSKKGAAHGFWNYASHISYTAAREVSSVQLGNGLWESSQFNSRLQPTQIALGKIPSATNLLKLNYEYGALNLGTGDVMAETNNGNVGKQTITVPTTGASPGFSAIQYYAYDSVNRLQIASENVIPQGQALQFSWRHQFIYDRYGNRKFDEANTTTLPRLCNNKTEVCPEDRKRFNPSANTSDNRLSSSDGYNFDDSGNLSSDHEGRTFAYDGENRQVKVTKGGLNVGEYFYDGDGKRVKKIGYDQNGAAIETTIFVYDTQGRSVAEYSTEVVPANLAEVAYTTSDSLGSPRINTDGNGAILARHDYHPFGEEIAGFGGRTIGLNYGEDDVRKKFTGYEKDSETNLEFAQARYFSAGFGRFSSADPTLLSMSGFNPQSFNRYAYVTNNPLVYTDPLGLWKIVFKPVYKTKDGKETAEVDYYIAVVVKTKGDKDTPEELARQLGLRGEAAAKFVKKFGEKLAKGEINGDEVQLAKLGDNVGRVFKEVQRLYSAQQAYKPKNKKSPGGPFDPVYNDCSTTSANLFSQLSGANGENWSVGRMDTYISENMSSIAESELQVGDVVRYAVDETNDKGKVTSTNSPKHFTTFIFLSDNGDPIVFSRSGENGPFQWGNASKFAGVQGSGVDYGSIRGRGKDATGYYGRRR